MIIKWLEEKVPDELSKIVGKRTRLFQSEQTKCSVLVSYDEPGWHLSISHPWRNPTWEEIKSARYELIPDEARMTMDLPPKEEFVNIHEYCFHLYECKCSVDR